MCVFLEFRLNVASVTKVIVEVMFSWCYLLGDLLNFLVTFECNAILCSLQYLVSFSQDNEIERHILTLKPCIFLVLKVNIKKGNTGKTWWDSYKVCMCVSCFIAREKNFQHYMTIMSQTCTGIVFEKSCFDLVFKIKVCIVPVYMAHNNI